MTVRCALSHRGWSRAVLLVLCVALLPLPAFAAEARASSNTPPGPATTASAPDLKAAVVKAVERDLAVRPAPAARRSAQSTVPNADSPSFFRSPAGVLVLAVFAAGVGYAIYSTQNDRINSPGKQ